MLIERGTLLARLEEASIGLSTKEVIEQSNCFIFKNGKIVTFNDDIMARVSSPLDFDAAVAAADLLGIISKIPDDEIDITFRGTELRVKGKRRTAGITASAEIALPVDAVPAPVKWSRIAEGTLGSLQQAARVCGDDDSQPLATVVHVGPQRVEACDNFRLYRVDGATGFPGDVLLPGKAVAMLDGLELVKVSIGEGWCHFKSAAGAEISLRCSHEKYHEGIDKLLVLTKPENITLPANLRDMVSRAEVFNTAGYDSRIGVRIGDNELVITSRKEGGWYRERKRIVYVGRPLDFEINPKFLVEILGRTRDVTVDDRKMKVNVGDRVAFVVCLSAKADEQADAE